MTVPDDDPDVPTAAPPTLGRRAALVAALGAGVGIAGLAGAPDAAASTGAMTYGVTNNAGASPTGLTSTAKQTLTTANTGSGVALVATAGKYDAIQATSADTKSGLYGVDASTNGGYGVFGRSTGFGTGVAGDSASGIGVMATGGSAGVWAEATGSETLASTAVVAVIHGNGTAIHAQALDRFGTAAELSSANGGALYAGSGGDGSATVLAQDFSPHGGVAVRALSENGIALDVSGRAEFTSSGIATVAAGQRSVVVTSWPVTAASLVLATIQTHRPGIYVEAATTDPTSGHFTIYLSGTVTAATNVAWFVLN